MAAKTIAVVITTVVAKHGKITIGLSLVETCTTRTREVETSKAVTSNFLVGLRRNTAVLAINGAITAAINRAVKVPAVPDGPGVVDAANGPAIIKREAIAVGHAVATVPNLTVSLYYTGQNSKSILRGQYQQYSLLEKVVT